MDIWRLLALHLGVAAQLDDTRFVCKALNDALEFVAKKLLPLVPQEEYDVVFERLTKRLKISRLGGASEKSSGPFFGAAGKNKVDLAALFFLWKNVQCSTQSRASLAHPSMCIQCNKFAITRNNRCSVCAKNPIDVPPRPARRDLSGFVSLCSSGRPAVRYLLESTQFDSCYAWCER